MTETLGALRFLRVAQDDTLAGPLLAELAVEYAHRYGGTPAERLAALRAHPGADFAPPGGGLIVGVIDGAAVTGGAFRRYDDATAELNRIWTDRRHRRRGYATVMLAELEREIAARGYRRVYLMTGDRQPEAEALYRSSGYTRLDRPLPALGSVLPIAFEKTLT